MACMVTGPAVAVSMKLFDTSEIPFTNNSGWLGFTLNYKYIEPVAIAINTTEAPLQTRGESHITVLTPPEFTLLSTANVTQDEVNDIALAHNIQSTKFETVCLGREEIVLDGKTYIVYQIIVKAPALVSIRQEIFRLYASKGGNTALFDPDFFKPHITVAYTVGDVFEQNGVYKGYNVCYAPIIITK
ncbi:hypothetical protein BX666DRAFT_1964179 [Dichotomocladium elegans]|nr:hypothetical protein BX666DRAFT_1964179 [Dichotomocladium elegans]